MKRPICPRCRLPQSTCVCDCAADVDNRMSVLILQHPLEAKEAKNSARLLQLGLRDCVTLIGETFEPGQLMEHLHAGGRAPYLLYPGGAGQTGAPEAMRLVLIDATWRKSRKMLHLNPLLAALPRFALGEVPASRYVIRKAHAAHQLSTLEAACLALGPSADAILMGFDVFVERVSRRGLSPSQGADPT